MSNLDFKKDILPFLVATIGEWFALFYWLKFQERGELLLANTVLWAGFLVERTSVILWLRYVHRSGTGIASSDTGFLKTAAAIVLITIPELIIWVGWLWLARSYGYWIAGAGLAVTMLFEHALELSLVKQVKLRFFLTNPPTLFFTAMEVLAAVAWLILVDRGHGVAGGAVLLLGLTIEHIIEGATLKDPVQEAA